MTAHHQHEKRHGRRLSTNQFSCAIYRTTPADRKMEKPLLHYEMEMRYCIRCNAQHWFLGERLDPEVSAFNPNDYWTWQLEEMGFFNKGQDTTAP